MLFLIASPLNQDSEENHDVVVFLYETFEEPAMQNTSKLVLFVLDIVILKANYRSMVVALLQRFANGPYTVMVCAGDNECPTPSHALAIKVAQRQILAEL